MGNPPQTPVWFPGLLGQSGQGTDSLRRLSVTPAPGRGGGTRGAAQGSASICAPVSLPGSTWAGVRTLYRVWARTRTRPLGERLMCQCTHEHTHSGSRYTCGAWARAHTITRGALKQTTVVAAARRPRTDHPPPQPALGPLARRKLSVPERCAATWWLRAAARPLPPGVGRGSCCHPPPPPAV